MAPPSASIDCPGCKINFTHSKPEPPSYLKTGILSILTTLFLFFIKDRFFLL